MTCLIGWPGKMKRLIKRVRDMGFLPRAQVQHIKRSLGFEIPSTAVTVRPRLFVDDKTGRNWHVRNPQKYHIFYF